MNLNSEQEAAIERIIQFLRPTDKDPYIILSGAAGTGKTTTVKGLVPRVKGRMIFTAPTNKATKILRDIFLSKDFHAPYKPECRTIYSLLGLRMLPNGEVKELVEPEDPVELSDYTAVVVDEGSMINKQLFEIIKDNFGVTKFIFMADYYQLPPVKGKADTGKNVSPIWDTKNIITLQEVMRHKNEILDLATRIRKQVDAFAPNISIVSDNKHSSGVWRHTRYEFMQRMLKDAEDGNMSEIDMVKVIAWRNKTVEKFNSEIRQRIYNTNSTLEQFLPGDRIIMMEPAKDLYTSSQGFVATVDDEGTVERRDIAQHPFHPSVTCYKVLLQLDYGPPVVLWSVHPTSWSEHCKTLMRLAADAKRNGRLWKNYWDYRDSFHSFRYSYAITAHKAQGSTYDKVYVDSFDILQNYDRNEAFRCLYVACTRPRVALNIV